MLDVISELPDFDSAIVAAGREQTRASIIARWTPVDTVDVLFVRVSLMHKQLRHRLRFGGARARVAAAAAVVVHLENVNRVVGRAGGYQAAALAPLDTVDGTRMVAGYCAIASPLLVVSSCRRFVPQTNEETI